MRKLMVALFALTALLSLALPGFAQEDPGTIADIVVASSQAETPEFSTLLAAVQAADPAVLEALSDPAQSLTVFAPTDAAFAALAEALGEEAFNAVLADPAALTNILLYHVVPGAVMSADVVGMLEMASGMGQSKVSVQTLQGQSIDIAPSEGGVTVDNANLNLEMVDIQASNGVIHVIDAVILPESRTIADIVVESAGMAEGAEFTSLLAAVQAADPAVLETLSAADANITVFAPTDAAFAALGEETLNAVLADQAALTNILLYHVVPDTVSSTELGTLLMGDMMMDDMMTPEAEATEAMMEMMPVEVATAQGAPVTFTTDGTNAFINGATIILTDIDAANGVIHVIDAVILPPTE